MQSEIPRSCPFAATLASITLMCCPAFPQDHAASTATNDGLPELVTNLNANRFQERLAAQKKLERLTAPEIGHLGEIARTHPAAEVAMRIVDALEHHYISTNQENSRTASAVLESLLDCDRRIVREATSNVLMNHWARRTLLAVETLRQRGALFLLPAGFGITDEIRRPAAIPPRGFPGLLPGGNFIQVFITDEWIGNRDDLSVLQRMPDIHRLNVPAPRIGNFRPGFFFRPGQPAVAYPRLAVFVINGHPLKNQDVTWLRSTIGDARISDRGQVMLGIRAPWGATAAGCRIGAIVPHGSAQLSGLEAGDLITSVEGQTIESFEDLVEVLRGFQVGETVQVRVWRQSGLSLVDVELRGWKEYVRSVTVDVPDPTAESK